MLDYRAQLTGLAERMASARGLSEARIANLAGCDGNFFFRLRAGGGCRVDTLNRVMSFFSDNWPDEVPWPNEIVCRPSSEKVA